MLGLCLKMLSRKQILFGGKARIYNEFGYRVWQNIDHKVNNVYAYSITHTDKKMGAPIMAFSYLN